MQKKKRFKLSLTKLYLGSFGIFIIGFFMIFVSPMVTGGTYSYAESAVNEYQTLGNALRIALVKKEYNPEKEIMRLDFSIEETTATSSLSNIDYEISSEYIKKRGEREVEVTRVNDDYIVAIVKGVPEDFSVLSTTIKPKYIHPELQKNNDLENRNVKVYVNESEKIINNELKIGTERDYQKEYISYQQEQIKNEIKQHKQEIKTNELAIGEVNKLISNLEKDLQYQTQEEKFETKNAINSHETSINQYKSEIETIEKIIEELNEKINLLDEKRNTI